MTIFAARFKIASCAETRHEKRRDQPKVEDVNLMVSEWKALLFKESVIQSSNGIFVVRIDRKLKGEGHSK